jgi:DnaJ-domain-containing protein 1
MLKYLIAFLAVLYVLIPYDLLPDFLVGWGWLDDLLVLWLMWQFFKSQSKRPSTYQNYFNTRQTFGHDSKKQSSNQEGAGTDSQSNPSDIPKDPYTVLNIDRTASAEEIKRAYRRLAGQYHPDKVQHLGEEFRELAEKRFKEIEEAYRKIGSGK